MKSEKWLKAVWTVFEGKGRGINKSRGMGKFCVGSRKRVCPVWLEQERQREKW